MLGTEDVHQWNAETSHQKNVNTDGIFKSNESEMLIVIIVSLNGKHKKVVECYPVARYRKPQRGGEECRSPPRYWKSVSSQVERGTCVAAGVE